jgi:hypothetical protein
MPFVKRPYLHTDGSAGEVVVGRCHQLFGTLFH